MQKGSCNSALIDVTDACCYYYYYTVQNYSDATMQVIHYNPSPVMLALTKVIRKRFFKTPGIVPLFVF